MLKLGELLILEGLISQSDFDRAMLIKARRGGRLGPILVDLGVISQPTIDDLWRRKTVAPILDKAFDAVSGGAFTKMPGRRINYIKLIRNESVSEDLMAGSRFCGLEVTIVGEATIQIGQSVSLPVDFSIDETTNVATLSDAGQSIVKRWLALIERNQSKAA